jgi:6-phosphogluconolactonase (cycloisomerase 2 family)
MKRLIGYTAVLCLLALMVGCGGVNSTGTLAYISNSTGTGFTVYNVNTDGTLTTSSISPQDTPTAANNGPKQIVFAPNGQWAYYLDKDGTNLYGYHRTGEGVLDTAIPGLPYSLSGASSLAISPNNNFLYVALPNTQNGELQVLSIDSSTGELSGSTPVQVGYPIEQLVMAPGGSILYGLSREKQSIVSWTLNSTNVQVTQAASTPVGPKPSFLILSANGSYIYVPDSVATTPIFNNGQVIAQSPNIYAFTTASNGVLTQMSGSPFDENPDINGLYPSSPIGGVTSNDNRYLFIANQGSKNISVFKINVSTQLGEPVEVLGTTTSVNGIPTSTASPFDCGCTSPSFVSVSLANNGLYLLDSTPNSNKLYQFRIDQTTGRVRAQNPASVPVESATSNPTWITIR